MILCNVACTFRGAKGTSSTAIDEEKGEAIAAPESIRWAINKVVGVLHLEGDNKNVVAVINENASCVVWTTNSFIQERLVF